MMFLKISIFFSSLFCIFTGCTTSREVLQRPSNAKASSVSIYEFKLLALDGSKIDFSTYKGKKIIIMNVASKCGFTPQYADWEQFYESHKATVAVLGFPANDFLMQEPGSNSSIGEFCQKNYGVTFQMFEKLHVKGSEQAALYRWLSSENENGWNQKTPSWNFCKYLIDENGQLQAFFPSSIKPTDAEFLKVLGQ